MQGKKKVLNVSDLIRSRIIERGASYAANDNIAEFFENDAERKALKQEIEAKVLGLLESLVIDLEDSNVQKTAHRVAKMYMDEVFYGRYHPCPSVADYPNTHAMDELCTVGPIQVRSACSHHLVPVIGRAWIGVMPGKRILGISKFSRLVSWVMSRPQMQEEATMMLGRLLEKRLHAKGIGIWIEAKHYCMHWRGVKEVEATVTTAFYGGVLRTDKILKHSFLQRIPMQSSS